MKMLLWRAFGVMLMLTALAVPLARAPDRPVETLVARWAPAPSDFIEVKGQMVHLRDEGPRNDQAPIVLIHGTSASLHTWEGWVAALKSQRRVISFDLPGFGLTGPFTGEYAHDDYRGDTLARFTLDLLDRLHVQRVVLAGNSLGGEVAWRVASLAPARVEKLVLVDSAGYDFVPEDMPVGFRIARLPVISALSEWFLPRGMVEASVQNVYGEPAKVTSSLVDRYFELTLREGNRHALRMRMQQLEMGQDASRIPAIKQPTLILWGGRDRLIPPPNGQRFARDIGGSRLVVFPELGHVPHEEDPARTVAVVKDFLSSK
ncbi:MAG TPA: alpha/beta hydrolase [Ideonella sp.]|uniref:alpha/beta fold hydrolase n=1 Tax=Ideonella sp. TaxID=1929293 RepID=UPI002E34EAC8|nr:alpha/beta hydrolase [Ideonella sp.]HEX5685999.1 alpha/beta hydrolase [Ideonella sp.]